MQGEPVTAAEATALPSRTPALFRFRVFLFTLLYFIGFYAPWARYFSTGPVSTTWITLSAWVARTNLLDYAKATMAVTILAIVCAVLGASFRFWATAYIGTGVMKDGSLRADHVVASGPYRYLRNPLYLGNLLTCAAVSILMPPSGALVFLVGCVLLTAALVAAEGPHLALQLGAAYETYRKQIPSFLPALRTNMPPAAAKPHWGQALVGEVFHVGFALCLLVFAWQYNVDLLIRCLLICFGISLVANGIYSSRTVRPVIAPSA